EDGIRDFHVTGVQTCALPIWKYYLARKPRKAWQSRPSVTCSICEHPFEPEDMAWCPAYAAPICSLCCSLDARCHDMCKPHAHFRDRRTACRGRMAVPVGEIAL